MFGKNLFRQYFGYLGGGFRAHLFRRPQSPLGCRDFARIDFRINGNGRPYFIEINPLPGLGTYSDLVIMTAKLGWSHENLINTVLEAALERYPQCVRV